MARLRFRIWQVLNGQLLRAAVLLDDDCFPDEISFVAAV